MDSSILFIAPYRHIGVLAKQVIESMGLSIRVEVAYDYEAIEAVRKHKHAKIVISRGGTAKVLMGVPGLTVVNTEASFYDVFIAIKNLLKQGCHNISVVTQDNVIGLEAGQISIKGEEVSIIPCKTVEDIQEKVEQVVENGCDGIAGCVVAVESARRFDVPTVFVDSDFFTVKKAILAAQRIEASMRTQDLMLERMGSLLNTIEEGVIIFDQDHLPDFYNAQAEKLLSNTDSRSWHQKLKPYLKSNGIPSVAIFEGRKIMLRNLEFEYGSAKTSMVVMQDSSVIEESAKNMKIAVYEKGLYARSKFADILHHCQSMNDAVELAQKFAVSDSTVLIFGETGVGKEGFAQSIHNASTRSEMPFVSVNCASLPQGLVASELFGYVDGAFTGARKNGKKGLFEMAQGGTVFLDEVTELPLDVQSQLLRVIQEREIMRIGDDKLIPLDIRIICACNKNMLALCNEGKFRFDLYYRLNVLRLSIPPLRERGEDIEILFRAFLGSFLHEQPQDLELEQGVINLLDNYRWPGNVRELRNIAEALSFYGKRVRLENLQSLLEQSGGAQRGSGMVLELSKHASLREVEQAYLKKVMSEYSIKEACELTGLSRTTLWRRLREFDLADPSKVET